MIGEDGIDGKKKSSPHEKPSSSFFVYIPHTAAVPICSGQVSQDVGNTTTL